MTKIHYWDKRDCQELLVNGHAGTAEGGNVVCAGISAITLTLHENLRREEEKGQIKAWSTTEKGHMFLHAETTDENRAAIRNMFKFAMVGLRMIAEEYPDKVKIKEEKRNGGI